MERWRALDALLAGAWPAEAVQRPRERGELAELLPEVEANERGKHPEATAEHVARCASSSPTRLGQSPMRRPQEAEPSHVCGLPAQHQPSFGRPSLIHRAVTRLSPQREPSSENPPFLATASG